MTSAWSRIIKGDDSRLNFSLLDESDNAIDLTNAISVTFRLKSPNNETVFEYSELDSQLTITDATEGQVLVTISSSTSLDLELGIHRFEVEVVDENGLKTSMRDENGEIFKLLVTETF